MSGPAHRLLRRELRARRRELLHVAGWSVVEALPVLLSGVLLSAATDRFLAGRFLAGAAVLGALLPAAAVGAYATRRLFPWLAEIVEPVRDALLTAVVRGAVHTAADALGGPGTTVVSRLTAQVQTVRNILFGLLRTVRQTVFALIAALAGLALLAPPLALATALLVAVAALLFRLLLPGLVERHRRSLAAGEAVAGRAGSVFTGLRDVLACAAADRAADEVDRAAAGDLAANRALVLATSRRAYVILIGGQLPLVLLLLTAPWLVASHRLTVGAVVGAAAYLAVTLEPALRQLFGVVGSWGLELSVAVRRLGETFAEPEPDRGRPVPEGYDVTVGGLTFAYGRHARPVVENLDLWLPQDAHLAVVGPSGVGKSSLAHLIAGLLPAGAGVVRLGGADVTDLAPAALRRRIGLIPQEAYVFAGTVRENLLCLAPAVRPGQIDRAVAAVGLDRVLDRLGGLDARIGPGGAELSQGERQLIALARVHLSPARLTILDEATAHLDPVAEERVELAFRDRPGTLVVIAHRISSARRADRILLLGADGTVSGTHDELVRSSPEYAQLVRWWDLGRSAAHVGQ